MKAQNRLFKVTVILGEDTSPNPFVKGYATTLRCVATLPLPKRSGSHPTPKFLAKNSK
jgi:hypothetical protein